MSLTSSSVFAEETIPTLGKDDRISLKQGQKFTAPKEGQFVSKEAMAKILSDYKAKIATLEAKLENEKQVCKEKLKASDRSFDIERNAHEKALENCSQTCELQKSILEKSVSRNAKLAERRWYESPWLPFVGGVLVCGGSVAAGASIK